MEVVWREVGDLGQSLEGQVLSKVAFDVVDNGIDPFDISGTLLAELGPAERLPFGHVIACRNERLMASFCQLGVGCGGDGTFASWWAFDTRLENEVRLDIAGSYLLAAAIPAFDELGLMVWEEHPAAMIKVAGD